MNENKVYTKICPVCRKKFTAYDADEWAYRHGKKLFCSYGCLRKFEKVHEKTAEGMTLGKLADDLFDVGDAKNEVKFKVIGFVNRYDELGFRNPVEISENAILYDVSKGVDGKITITVEV